MARRSGYVKTSEEDEGRRSSSWINRRIRTNKTPRMDKSNQPLLVQVMSSSDEHEEPRLPVLVSPLPSEISSKEVRIPPERASPSPEPLPSSFHRPTQKRTTTPKRAVAVETAPSTPEDQIILGVTSRLQKDSSPKSFISTSTTTKESTSSSIKATMSAVEVSPKIRAVLSRSFGRNNLPPHVACNWVVEVSPAEWDAEEEQWKYRILAQKRDLSSLDESMTTAYCWRRLADFMWLESALQAEYHGALLLPLLSHAIGTPHVANFTQQDVDSQLLQDWLNAVLNGIRGQGELVLNQEPVDLLQSEAMEAFLYRNAGPASPGPRSTNSSALDHQSPNYNESFVDLLWIKPFSACLPMDVMCGANLPSSNSSKRTSPVKQTKKITTTLPLHMMACSSRALGDAATFELQDSFSDFDLAQNAAALADALPIQQLSSSLAIHSELLEAERELVSSYRRVAISAMDKGRILMEAETQVAVAWKRFAISLSALYSYEKDNETLRVEDGRPKKHPTYRKLGKTNVDELLRVMMKQKSDRYVPALKGLDAMLSAYVGDLSAVNPSIKAYSESILQLSTLEQEESLPPRDGSVTVESSKQRSVGSSSACWQDQLRTLTNGTINDAKKQIAGESIKTETTSTTQSTEGSQKRTFEGRVLGNERLLRDSLTALCRSTPIRVGRMAWHYFSTELTQANLLKSCAYSMRTKVNIINRDALADMIERHKKESVQDSNTELDLVQRIITIEDYKKGQVDSKEAAVVDDDGFKDDKKQALLRSEAMQLVRSRVGRWDSKVGLAIMKAVGAEEGEVRVDETTRELRLVRKFAIGLREQLHSCTEALKALEGAVYHGDPDALVGTDEAEKPGESNYLTNARRHFVDDITDVFSGVLVNTQDSSKPKSASTSKSVLAKAGIELEDPAGWSSAAISASASQSKRKIVPRKRRGRCGELTVSYTDLKNTRTEKLLTTLSDLLESYQQRLESIESYVYMQCVGIQLEKHFSQQRSEALAAFEKKTDISTAISIAQRKKLPLLVSELEAKMSTVANVTHTDVKKLKEIHLVSKSLKTELSALATRRFLRLRETSTERVIGILTVWAQYEEEAASAEINALGEVTAEVERQFASVDFTADGISHTFFGKSSRTNRA